MRIDLGGRTALVTGGASGIGLGIVQTLASAGARVAINDVDAAAAEAAAHSVGLGSFAVVGDVSDEISVARIIAEVEPLGLDILINNAGIADTLAPIGEQVPATWDRVVAVNLRGCYLTSKAAALPMKARGAGAIVNIASIAGLTGFPASHAYGVSKAGVAMMTKTLATELVRYGIRVNAVAPGVIDAPMLTKITRNGRYLPEIVRRVPMGRVGRADEIGNAVAFLCSDLADYITGAILPVDGGWLAFGGAGDASAWMTPSRDQHGHKMQPNDQGTN